MQKKAKPGGVVLPVCDRHIAWKRNENIYIDRRNYYDPKSNQRPLPVVP